MIQGSSGRSIFWAPTLQPRYDKESKQPILINMRKKKMSFIVCMINGFGV